MGRPAISASEPIQVEKKTPSGCLEIVGHQDEDGYGHFQREGKRWSSHRLAWVQAYGPIPDQLFVLHSCDNPPCVNPAHLFLGTAADNHHDAMKKGRNTRGEAIGVSRLTEIEVVEIRRRTARGQPQASVAEDYGVSQSTISDIVTGKIWRHVPAMEG